MCEDVAGSCVGAVARAWGRGWREREDVAGACVAWGRAVRGRQVRLLWWCGAVWRAVARAPAEGVACPVGLVWGLESQAARVRKALGKEGQAV